MCLLVSVSNFSLTAASAQISVNLKKASLKVALQHLQEQTTTTISYSDAMLAKHPKRVTLNLENSSLSSALSLILDGVGLGFREVNGNIVVYELPQQRIISGTVYDQTAGGETLPGVAVSARGSGRSTSTDADGRYQIDVQDGDELTFRMIGYEELKVNVENQQSIDVELMPSTSALDEVVVVGYGTQRKINLTGAVSAISSEDLEGRPITNVGRGLQGQMPGVTVRNQNTAPGGNAPQIRIRGVGTWGDANPLVVIDGIPGGDLNILNPDDIESVSVLKDAASSSIYGVRGANGVILVTTKKGKAGSPNISLTSYYGRNTPTALPKFLGSPDFMTLQNEASINAGQTPVYTAEQIETARNGSDPNYFANTDWIAETYRDFAPQTGHNLNIDGGGDNMNYYLSYGYLGEGGLVVGDNFNAKRHNIRLRVNTTLMDRLQVDANVGYIDRDVNSNSGGTGGRALLGAATSIRPLVPVKFTNGSWGYHGGQSNPVAIANDGGFNEFGSQEVTANISATLNIIEGLDLRAQYGLVSFNSKRTVFDKTINYFSPDDNQLIYQTNFPNQIGMTDYKGVYQTFIGTATYAKTFAEKHDFTALLGASQEDNITTGFSATRQNLPTQDVPSLNLGTQNPLNNSSGTQNALQSVFGRVNYAFNDKYLAEANFRYDGSSRFAPDVRWNWFGSASVGWVFSEERFFRPLKALIESGKIRASYGTQGNDRVRRPGANPDDFTDLYYPYMAILSPVQVGSNNPIGNQPRVGFRQTDIPNRSLTWETAEKFNVGVDFMLLNGRLGITGDYFINNTNDILLTPPLPDVIGVGTGYPPQNSGAVQNKGWELNLAWKDKVGEVNYGLNFNLSDVRNKITRLDDYAQNLGDRVRLLGQPLDAFYGFIAERIAQVEDFTLENGEYIPNFPFQAGDLVGPGDLIYRPQSPDDEAITVGKDRHVLGSDIPRYTYGFRGDLGWKGIDFSFFIQGVGKADGWLTGSARHPFINNSAMPQEVHLDRWTPENPNASYPRFVYLRNHNTRLSSYWIENAAYLRLKNVQVGYTLPARITEKFRAGKVRFYASAENLFTMTDFFYGYDPEIPVGNNASYYPQVKTFVFGLNVNFK